MNIVELRNEIRDDPQGLGYSGMSSGEIADILNAVGGSGETVDTGVIDSYLVVNAFDPTELAGLTVEQRSVLSLVLSAGRVDSSNTNVLNIFKTLFGAGTTTRASLIALSRRTASRAEALGFGRVKPGDIDRAFQLMEV